MNKESVSFKQGYDQGFSDAICCEENAYGYPVSDGERDWFDGYYEGHVAGESSLLADDGRRLDGAT